MNHIPIFVLVVCAGGAALAQPPIGPGPQSTENLLPQRIYPSIRLIYYAGFEGNSWKEVANLDLDGWTPQKDVIISATWVPRTGLTAPGARSPEERLSGTITRRRTTIPVQRSWFVEYADAATEGESHLFVNAPGLPRLHRRILSADDVVAFLHVPTSGWHELGAATRAYRRFLQESPSLLTPSPSDVRSR